MDYPIQNQSKRTPTAQTLSYAQSLRAIGQALEAFRLKAFELHKNGPEYILHVGVSESAGKLLVSLVVVENRFFGIGAQIFLSQLPYNERSLNSQRLSIPPVTRLSAVKLV